VREIAENACHHGGDERAKTRRLHERGGLAVLAQVAFLALSAQELVLVLTALHP